MDSHYISKKDIIKIEIIKGTVLKHCALTYPYNTLSRKSLVRSFCGLEKISSGVPLSTT
jgi:hypothetical protein